jgi:chromosome segregation ATPase
MSTAVEPYSVAGEVFDRHIGCLGEAEILLREINHDGRVPTFAELTFFKRECGWDQRAVNDQIRRVNSVLRFTAIAGGSADRKATSKEAATAAEILEKEGPKLAAKIEELQTKLSGLERDARLSAKRCEEQSEAVQRLRELVPEHIAGEVRSEVGRIEATVGREMLDSETRANELECCLTPSKYRDERGYLEALQRSFRDAVTVITENNIIRRRLSPEWPTIRAGIQNELAELKPRIETLRSQRAEAIEAAEKPLGYYAG